MNHREDIKKELSEISPFLLALKDQEDMLKKSKNSFQNNIRLFVEKVHADNEIASTSILTELRELSFKKYFSVPNNYFKNLPNHLLLVVKSSVEQPNKVIFKRITQFAVAACLIGIIGVSLVNFFKTNREPVKQPRNSEEILNDLSTVPESEIINYLEENGTDLDAALLASLDDDSELPDEEELLLDNSIYTQYGIEINEKGIN